MTALHICLNWADRRNCIRCCSDDSSHEEWKDGGKRCDVLKGGKLAPPEGSWNLYESVDELDHFLREDWKAAGWRERLEKHAKNHGKQLFNSPQLKLGKYYQKCAELGDELLVVLEHRVPKEGDDHSITFPSEFWWWAEEFNVLAHPVVKRIKQQVSRVRYHEPLLFPELPDIVLLIAGEPEGFGNPSADAHVEYIAAHWNDVLEKLHNTDTTIIPISSKEATESYVQKVIEDPLTELDARVLSAYQSRHLTGLIHWVGKAKVVQDELQSLWVRNDKNKEQELRPSRLVDFIKRAAKRRIRWQFFFLCSYRDNDDETPIPKAGCSLDIEPLVLKAGVPSVLGLLRPLWRESARDLAYEFHFALLESHCDTTLPETDMPKALLQVRNHFYDEHIDASTEHCYYTWASPVLIMQQMRGVKMVSDMIEAYFVGLGDPKEPGRVFLRRLWEEVFPKKTIADVYVDSLFKAIQEEPKTADFEITRNELRKVLKYPVDLEGVDLHKLSQDQFFERMTLVLRNNLPFPDTEDPAQIIRNLLRRTHAEITSALSSEKNTDLWQRLMMEEAKRSGTKLDEVYDQVTEILPQVHLLYVPLEEKVTWIGDGVEELAKKLEGLGVDVADVKENMAKFLALQESLAVEPLTATSPGKQIIEHTPALEEDEAEAIARLAIGRAEVNAVIRELEALKELAHNLHLKQKERSKSAKCWDLYEIMLRQLGRLCLGQYYMSDLKISDLEEKLRSDCI